LTTSEIKYYSVVLFDPRVHPDSFNLDFFKKAYVEEPVSFVLAVVYPEQLIPLWSLISAGVFEHIVVSGSEKYLIYDCVSYCKRLNNLPVRFDMAQNVDTLSAILSFKLDTEKSTDLNGFVSSISALRLLDSSVTLSFERLQAALNNKVVPGLVTSISESNCLFFSERGLKRLGGFEVLKKAPWTVGEIEFKDISKLCLLSKIEQPFAKLDNVLLWPEVVNVSEHYHLLFDIYPAAEHPLLYNDSEQMEWPTVRLPRFVMAGRIVDATIKPCQPEERQAVFVMSSYNKATFITSAIWAVVGQTYSNIHLNIVDDNSSDETCIQVGQYFHHFPKLNNLITLDILEKGIGTYAIRNHIVASAPEDSVYLVNDADDLSSAQRASIQMAQLSEANNVVNIGDIVRLADDYSILQLDDHVEHYGSASLASTPKSHKEIGYYQALRKGADTEFIQRVQRFLAQGAFSWIRYPLLYQTFAFNNLTQDIYQRENNTLIQKISSRQALLDSFTKFHQQIALDDLAALLPASHSVFPAFYADLANDIFVHKKSATWVELLKPVQDLDEQYLDALNFEGWNSQVFFETGAVELKINSTLTGTNHHYIYHAQNLNVESIIRNELEQSYVYFEMQGTLGISIVLVFLDVEGEKISHQFFWANHKMAVNMPAACKYVKLGFRLQGPGTADIVRVCFT
jgi:glycosyltransferase involved in cell wall biosynthesis